MADRGRVSCEFFIFFPEFTLKVKQGDYDEQYVATWYGLQAIRNVICLTQIKVRQNICKKKLMGGDKILAKLRNSLSNQALNSETQ